MSRKVLLTLLGLVFSLLMVAVIASPVADPQPATAAPTADPTTVLMHVKGAVQGDIEGGATQRGHEGWIEVISYSHEIVSPRDAASGLPTGKRQHKPFVITKELDKATPLLFKALTSNETLSEVKFEFFKGDPRTAKQTRYFTIELRNASIAGIASQFPGEGSAAGQPIEHVSFVYQKIIWTWTDGGITSEDDWETPTT